jgi:nitroimidazol reductase NimA-like FMN-containing flavoprotein (pyridoxamine 5'-phosphate oxidase superfamily)
MTTERDLGAVARSIIDRNRFMTLATADAEGLPWASPVWYAPRDPRELFWVSSPEARHSHNVAARPQVAIVIFDSHLAGGWESLYMSAVAEQVAEVDEAIAVYTTRSVAQGLPAWTRENVVSPARHRMYRALVSEHFVLDGVDRRVPVPLEQLLGDAASP